MVTRCTCHKPGTLATADCDCCHTLSCVHEQALGHHQAALCFQAVSDRSPGKVLHEVMVAVQGSSLSLGPKQPALPGGPDATPDTFTLPRWDSCCRVRGGEVAPSADVLEGDGKHNRWAQATCDGSTGMKHTAAFRTHIMQWCWVGGPMVSHEWHSAYMEDVTSLTVLEHFGSVSPDMAHWRLQVPCG